MRMEDWIIPLSGMVFLLLMIYFAFFTEKETPSKTAR